MASPTAPLIIFALPGSQFVFKVLAAIQARKLEHFVEFVPIDAAKRKKVLPNGGLQVPVMQVGKGDNKVVVPDSEKILHWLDDNCQTNLFPDNSRAQELSERASDGVLATMVWFYNWVDNDGYKRSMKATIGKVFPPFVPWFVVDMVLKSTRTKFTHKVQSSLKIDQAELQDGPAMKQKLVEELVFFQDLFLSDQQTYLLPGQEQPTAPDFSVYAQLERLVGGNACDVEIPPAIPDLLEDKSLQRLWTWHRHMRSTYPVQFKGKRPPKEILSKL